MPGLIGPPGDKGAKGERGISSQYNIQLKGEKGYKGERGDPGKRLKGRHCWGRRIMQIFLSFSYAKIFLNVSSQERTVPKVLQDGQVMKDL